MGDPSEIVEVKEEEDELYMALNAESYVEDIPTGIKDLEKRSDRDKWNEAIEQELNSLKESNTWTLTDLPEGRKAIASKWVFKTKKDTEDKRMKHVDVKYNFIIHTRKIDELKYIPSNMQEADILTKGLDTNHFERMRKFLNVEDVFR